MEPVLRVELVGGGAEAEEGDGGWQAAESERSVRKVCLFVFYDEDVGRSAWKETDCVGERNFDIRKRWRVVEVAQAQAGIESAWVCGGRCLSRLGFGRIRFRMLVIVAGLVFDRRDVVDGAVKAFGCCTT